MCGIIGCISNKGKVIYDLVFGLTALQHRGQDAAGVITFKKNFRLKKGLGLVNNVFGETHLKRLKGPIGIGHVRYTTQSSNDLENAQPFWANYPFGMAMVHNGNVTNFKELRKTLYKQYHILPETSNDLELILYTFATKLAKRDLAHITPDDIFNAVAETQALVKGAYSTITVIGNHGLLVFTDPHGIRPIVMGKRVSEDGQIMYCFASESSCFDYLEYEFIEDVAPGEAIFIDMDLNIHRSSCLKEEQAFCVFELIYFAREDSVIQNRLVATERVRMGRRLAKKVKEKGLIPDIVIDVPSSGYFSASGLAEALNIPYRRGFVKNQHVGRSFIAPTQKGREDMVKRKLNPIRKVVEGKRVAVVDDSIVRGTTSRRIVQSLRRSGAKEIYFISAAPPIKHPCVYGIDMAIETELIAANKTEEEIAEFIGADAVVYQSLEDLQELYKDLPCCFACFNADYPVVDSVKMLKEVAKERVLAKS